MDRETEIISRQSLTEVTARVSTDVTSRSASARAQRVDQWDGAVAALRVVRDRSGAKWVEITTPDGETIRVDYYPHGRRGIGRALGVAARDAARRDTERGR